MVLIEVSLATTAAQREALLTLLAQTMAGSQSEVGCLSYRFSVDLSDPLVFHLNELWQDEAALLAHVKGPHFACFMARFPSLGQIKSSVARNGDLQPYRVPR